MYRGGLGEAILPIFEIARALVRFDYIASFIKNAKHSSARLHPAHYSGVG